MHTGSNAPFIYTSETNQYGTTGNSLGLYNGKHKFDFSDDISVYEVSFRASAVNYAWSIEWHFKDGTSETTNHPAQSNSHLPSMYEDIYKSYTDYNAVETNTDKFIDYFIIDLSDLSLVDTMYWQYDDAVATGSFATTTTTTTTLPPPTPDNASSVSVNYGGTDVEFSWEYTDGSVDAHAFHINYSYDNSTFTRVIITDTALREYDLDKSNIQTRTFY